MGAWSNVVDSGDGNVKATWFSSRGMGRTSVGNSTDGVTDKSMVNIVLVSCIVFGLWTLPAYCQPFLRDVRRPVFDSIPVERQRFDQHSD